MKKQCFINLILLTHGILLNASPVLSPTDFSAFNFLDNLFYDGSKDTMLLENINLPPHYKLLNQEVGMNFTMHEKLYYHEMITSTLGGLAYYADVIGVGRVSDVEEKRFKVTVEHALAGCTKNVSFTALAKNYDLYFNATQHMPTNNSRIVFAGSFFEGSSCQAVPIEKLNPKNFRSIQESLTYKKFYLLGVNRSWWHVDRDDGLLLTQFTNIIQAVRIDCNWTNYYNLCRDAAISPSVRIREDGFSDIRWLLFDLGFKLDPEIERFMDEDPLLDPKHKAFLFRRLGKTPVTEEEMENYHAALEKLKTELQHEEKYN